MIAARNCLDLNKAQYRGIILYLKCYDAAQLNSQLIIRVSELMSYANSAKDVSLDHESRLVDGDHQAIRLWLRLLTCTNLIEARLRSRLRDDFATTLPRFDFMAQLVRAPDGLTMGELSRRMMVSGGNISGIAAQLEGEGLIHREPVPENRRSHCVRLTEHGQAIFAEMAAEHEVWVESMLGHLAIDDIDQLMNLLRKIKSGVADADERL